MKSKDVLIIVSDSASEETKKMAAGLPVRQEISMRVRIVHIDATQAAAIRKLEGIYLVDSHEPPPAIASTLTEGERLFVRGWLARVPESEKQRAGEGLDWDDPNFEPPDSL